ncbi:MAG: hypothetical protein JNL60_19310 [Bacteroidia bacterium]|nr:hypothetical protein [Bacteroidia bacterium]
MKKTLLLAIAGGMLVVSCGKTYQCKDAAGNITGEVTAYSQEKANEMCKKNGSQVAVKK